MKKRGAWREHPSSFGFTRDCRNKCVPKIEQTWTRFWQRTGQLDHLVQKLGVCPRIWTPENLSTSSKLPSGLKANSTAANLPGRLET